MDYLNWSVADWLQLSYLCLTALGILVTGFMTYWVVETVQSKVDSEKTLRDHFAHEIIDLRKDARALIANLTSENKMSAGDMKKAHYLLQTQINELLKILNSKYNIPKQYLKAYRLGILNILEKDAVYTASYKQLNSITLSNETKKALFDVSRNNDHVFNEILLRLYEQGN